MNEELRDEVAGAEMRGECSEHGPYEIGPDCPACVREVLEWTT